MQGITGKLSGRMGSAVFRVRRGTQVVAQYNPVVDNPNTRSQQEGRGKFKLTSQLGAVFAPVLGMQRSGAVTARNKFTRLNYGLIDIANNMAEIALADIKLTDSTAFCPAVTAEAYPTSVKVGMSQDLYNTNRGGTLGVLNRPARVRYAVVVSPISRATVQDPARVIATDEIDITESNPTAEATITYNGADVQIGETITVLAFVINEETQGGITNYSNQSAAAGTAAVAIDQSLRTGDVSVTDTVGISVVAVND